MKLAILSLLLAAGLAADPAETWKPRPCGDVECYWFMAPMREIGEMLGFRFDFDQVQIFTKTTDPEVMGFHYRVRYRFQGKPAESEHVSLRFRGGQDDGCGAQYLYFLDIRDVEVEDIQIKVLVTKHK